MKRQGQAAQDAQQTRMEQAARESEEYPLQIGPGYVCFWHNVQTDEYSASADEAHFTYAFIHGKLAEIFAVPGSFIGVSDRHGNTIQFEVRSDTEVWLDIPLVQQGGSMRTRTSLAQARALISRDAEDLSSLDIVGLEFEAWR